MIPYAKVWFFIDSSYTWDEAQPAYPNKSFLEVINFADPMGSLDPDPDNYPEPFTGQGDELVKRIRSVLKEYYGENWQGNPDAKVILMAHSQGGAVVREALKEDTTLIPHIAKIITANTPHLGTCFANLGFRDWMILSMANWHPYIHPIKWGLGNAFKWLGRKLPPWLVNPVAIDLRNHCIKIGGRWVINLEGDQIAMKIIEKMPSALFEIPGIGEYLTAFAVLEGILGPAAEAIAEIWGKEGFHVSIGSIPDDGEGSTFFRHLGTHGAGKIPFVCILGRGFYDDHEYAFDVPVFGKTTWGKIGKFNRSGWALTAGYWTLSVWFPKPFLEWAIKSTASELMWEWWNQDSDMIVRWGSQSVNHVSSEFRAREIKEWGIYHGRVLQRYDLVLKALEDRPLIDSVMLIQTFTDSQGVQRTDTVYLTENKIDTIITSFENLRIEGKLKKTHFLHISAPKIWINEVPTGKLKYPERCGYEGRKFFIDSTHLKYLGAGYNRLKIVSKNVVGEEFTRNYTLWMVPSGWFCMQESPDYRSVLKNLLENDTFKIRLIKLGLSDSLKTIAWDTLKVNFVNLIQDTNGWFVPDSTDTQFVLIPNNLYFYEDVEGVYNDTNYLLCPGKRLNLPFINLKNFLIDTFNIQNFEGIYNFYYVVNDSFKTVKSFHQFYVDKTPPFVEIIGPEGVYSINTSRGGPSDSIAIIAKIKDNFETELLTPKDLIWILKTEKGDSIYSKYYDEPGFYYYEDLFIDFIPKEVLKNLEDGKYYVEIRTCDRADNESIEARYFKIDTGPPEIYVIQKMDSILTKDKEYLEFKFRVNEWARFKLVLKNKNDTTIKYIKEVNALPHVFYDTLISEAEITGNKFVILNEEIDDGVYLIYAELTDSAGNTRELTGKEICGNSTLRVDKTPISLKDIFIQPFVGEDFINLSLKAEQINDKPENKKGGVLKIFIDSLFIKDFEFPSDSDTIKIYHQFDIKNLSYGKHILEIEAEDPFGSKTRKSKVFFRNTYGTEITFPLKDTLKRGMIVIEGRVSDPDIYDNLPFKNFEIYWTDVKNPEITPDSIDKNVWHSEFLEVREDLRKENEPLNFGFKEVNSENIIAFLNSGGISPGRITLLLISRDQMNSVWDTASFYLEKEFAQNPDIELYLKVERPKQDTPGMIEGVPGAGDTLLLDLTKGEKLAGTYFLKGVPSQVKFQILSQDNEILFEETD